MFPTGFPIYFTIIELCMTTKCGGYKKKRVLFCRTLFDEIYIRLLLHKLLHPNTLICYKLDVVSARGELRNIDR